MDEKKALTLETIKEDVLREVRADAAALAAPLVMLLLLSIVTSAAFFGLRLERVYLLTAMTLDAVILLASAVFTVKWCREIALVSKGHFDVVRECVQRISMDERNPHVSEGSRKIIQRPYRINTPRAIEHALYFPQSGRITAEREICENASEGDSFLLVMYRNRKKRVVQLYNEKIYRVEDGVVLNAPSAS